MNSVKHGKATEISIGFWQDKDIISLTISDNGKASEEEESRRGIGLHGMEERLAPFGGKLDARRYPHGFSLHISVPLASANTGVTHEDNQADAGR